MAQTTYQVLLPPFEISEGEGDNRKTTRIEADQTGKTIQLDSELNSVQSLVKQGVIAPLESPEVAETLTQPTPTSREEQLRLLYRTEGYKAIQVIADPLGIKKPEKGWEDAIPLIVAAEAL